MTRPEISEKDLVENPNPRVAVCLVLDTSGSMRGKPIAELNQGVKAFVNAIMDDEIAKYSAEIAVVTFGQKAETVIEFGAMEKVDVPILAARGQTIMAGGMNLALDLIEKRKAEYQDAGVDYYQPWIILMSDGRPGDKIDAAAERTRQMISKRKLTLFPIGIGEKADMDALGKFSPNRSALRLKGLKFVELFEWLSQSISRVSQSTPGERVNLDTQGLKGWADL